MKWDEERERERERERETVNEVSAERERFAKRRSLENSF